MVDAIYLKLLKLKSGVPLNQEDAGKEFEPFYDDEFLSYILEDSSRRHNRKPFRDNLAELPAVFILARIEVYTILAGAFAKNYDIGSKDGNLKKSQPFDHYQKLTKDLVDSYDTLSGSTSVRATPVLLSNKTRNIYRNHLNAPEPTVDINVVDNQETFIKFTVSPLSSVIITSFDIYLSDEPIYDLVEVNNINPTSTLVESVPYTTNTYQVTKQANSKYLGIVAKNKYGKQYILELNIELSANPPQTSGVA